MWKSLTLGYLPTGVLSASGALLLGGNVWSWLLLAWITGAALTLLIAAVRFNMPSQRKRKQVQDSTYFLKSS